MRFPLKLLGIVLYISFTAICYGQQDNHYLDSLLMEHHKMEKLPQTDWDQKEYIDTLLDICYEYAYINLDSLLHYAHKTAAMSKKLGSAKGMTLSASDIGFYHSMKGNSPKAIAAFNRALAVADSANLIDKKASAHNFLGIEYNYLLDYEKALFHYLKGLDYALIEQDSSKISDINENLALLYINQKQFKDAHDIYDSLTKFNQNRPAEDIRAENLVNLAKIENELGFYDKALNRIAHSISYFKAHGPDDWLAHSYEVKGLIYLKQKKYAKALPLLQMSDSLYGDKDRLLDMNLAYPLALANFGLKNYEKAKEVALKGLKEGQNQTRRNLEEEKDLKELLYKIYKQNGDIHTALYYHEGYLALSNSIHAKKNQTSLAQHKTKMSFEKDKQLLISKNKEALAKQRNVLWTTVAILLVLVAMSIPLYLNHKKLRELLIKIRANTKVLKEREQQLSATNKTKDRLFSIIGHDLRGPIATLKELLQMMTNGEIEKSSFDTVLPKVKKDVDHILFTLNNLLSWGNAQNKGTKQRPQETKLKNIAQQNIELLAEMAANKSIKVTNKISPASAVMVDVDQLDVVLRNLISNAIKFTPNGGNVCLKAKDCGDYWKIAVCDNGIGIDALTQQNLFAGGTITNYGTNKEKGTGLGLSLCKEMIANNKGNIWVQSEPQKGTTFYFTLPKAPKPYDRTA